MAKLKIDLDLVKRVLSVDEALQLLSPHKEGRKKRVHTFTSAPFALMGCDMDLTQLKKEMLAATKAKDGLDSIRIAGKNMNAINHGVAYWQDKVGWVFLATDKTKLDSIIKKRKINLES